MTPVNVKALSKEEMLPSSDYLFRSAVAVVPDIGLFYCVRDRYPKVAATEGASTGDDGGDHGVGDGDGGDGDDGGDSDDGSDGGDQSVSDSEDSDDGSDGGGGRPYLPLELSWLRIRRREAASEPVRL